MDQQARGQGAALQDVGRQAARQILDRPIGAVQIFVEPAHRSQIAAMHVQQKAPGVALARLGGIASTLQRLGRQRSQPRAARNCPQPGMMGSAQTDVERLRPGHIALVQTDHGQARVGYTSLGQAQGQGWGGVAVDQNHLVDLGGQPVAYGGDRQM